MKTTHVAILYPKDPNAKPIIINWDGIDILKPTRFFIKVCKNGLLETPSIKYKQIIYLYINSKLKYLKPFELI